MSRNLFASFLLTVSLMAYGSILAAPKQQTSILPADLAVAVLRSDTITEMKQAMALLQSLGGRIKHVHGTTVLIGNIPPASAKLAIQQNKNIEAIHYRKLKTTEYQHLPADKIRGIKSWNKYFDEKQGISKRPEQLVPSPEQEEILLEKDLPKNDAEKKKQQKQYEQHWKQKKDQLRLQYKYGSPDRSGKGGK